MRMNWRRHAVAAHDLGYQTLLDVDPQTGQVTYRPGMIPQAGVELEFCPDFLGIRNWYASAYHPETQALYIPIHPTCEKGMFTEIEKSCTRPTTRTAGGYRGGPRRTPTARTTTVTSSPWTSTAAKSCGGTR